MTTLGRAERDLIRQARDAELRLRLRRENPKPSIAELAFEAAQGDPILAVGLALDYMAEASATGQGRTLPQVAGRSAAG